MKRLISFLIVLFLIVVATHADTTPDVSPSISDLLKKANDQQMSKKYNESLATIEQAIQLDPTNTSALQTKSVVQGKYLLQKANDLQTSQKLDDALTTIEQAAQLIPDNTYVWETKSSILKNLNRPDEALIALNQTLHLNPGDKYALSLKQKLMGASWVPEGITDPDPIKRAVALQRSKKMDEALTTINQAIEQDPNNTEAWNTKASILLKMGDRERALTALNHTTQLDPDNAYAWHTTVTILQLLDRYNDEMLTAVDQDFRLNPSSNTLNNKAIALQGLGRYDEALAVVNQALELDPQNGFAQGTKKSILSRMGAGKK